MQKRQHSVREREDATQRTEPRPLVWFHHLLFIQQNLWFHGQDQIGGGVSQLAHVLIDVLVPLQPNVVVHVPGLNSRVRGCSREGNKPPLLIMLRDFFFVSDPEVKTENGAL